ncbi:MAG TPA: NAD(P)-binding domain-containing protein, partial [Spirochaetia bacterium]|nr:NAD(P)-binding domain-containing protein [Spirochaetia bacterium]
SPCWREGPDMTRTVGFAGLGVMGGHMARKVAERFDLVVFDVDSSRMRGFPAAAASLSELGLKAGVVLLSLPTSEVVRTAVLGKGGLAEALARGSVVVDMSTTEPAVIHEIGRALDERGISLLDAPVSGGEKGAAEGTLSFMVGGKQEVFDQCRAILQTMGSSIVRVGESGMGQVAKLVNNLIVGITFAAVAEGFVLGTRSGLKPEVLYEAIRNGWAGSRVLDVSVPAMLARDFRPGGTVDIHWKDLGYALAQAKETDVPVPVTALVHEIFKAARASGKGKLSQPSIVQLWESLLGIEVKKSL